MQIGVLGSGQVGETLANGFLKHGHSVIRGSRDPGKLSSWASHAGEGGSTGTFGEAASRAEVVVLAVKGAAAEDVVRALGVSTLAGKVVIDATNPIADEPPEGGVLRFFTGPNESLLERLQSIASSARFVKCFSCVGNGLMVNPDFGDTKPTMFIAGDDTAAKQTVESLLDQFGWEYEDMGGAVAARAIEPLCVLWCIPGLLRNEWSHAFKLLKSQPRGGS